MSMISRFRSRQLCQACRSDLYALFDYGSCHPSTVRKPFALRRSSLGVRSSNSRHISSSYRYRSSEDVQQGSDPRNQHSPNEELEKEMLAIQEAAIAELETKLGMPLEQAIAEHRNNDALQAKQEGFNTYVLSEVSVEDAENPFDQLRASGASEDEIVREAREIFGEYLPEGTLNDNEFKIYKRMYGDPLPDDVDERRDIDLANAEDVNIDDAPTNALFDIQGERIQYELESKDDVLAAMDKQGDPLVTYEEEESLPYQDQGAGHISTGVLTSPTNRAKDVANTLGAEVMDQEENEIDDTEEDAEPYQRTHPLTRLGKFCTSPRTTFLPQAEFVKPVQKVMSDYSNRQLKQMCEKVFGGPGLPDSAMTPRSGRTRKQIAIPLDVFQHGMGQMEANAFITSIMPPTYAVVLATLVETRKRLGKSWLERLLARPGGPRVLDAGSGGVGIIAWRELIKAHWETHHSEDEDLPSPPASKTVVLAASDTLRNRAAEMLENTTFIPRLPDYVHTRGMPTLEDDRPAQQRKQFDVIIASHSLMPLKEEWERRQHIQNLWSMLSEDGGIMILVEKGFPRGFEALAGARELLLERFIKSPEGHPSFYSSQIETQEGLPSKTSGMIVAPCTNHERCPLYRSSGPAHGRKDICSFQQRYIRPPFLQRVVGAKDRNHDDVNFSYLSVMKGDDLRTRHITTWEQVDDPVSAPLHTSPSDLAESHETSMKNVQQGFESFVPEVEFVSPESGGLRQNISVEQEYPDGRTRSNLPTAHMLPRLIYSPLKRRGHVTFDVCTPAGEIERWTIPKSFSKQAYRDARKARWGDLWALGAKTRIPRNIKVGTSEKDVAEKMRGDAGKTRSKKERRRMLADGLSQADEIEAERGLDELEELKDIVAEDNLFEEDEGTNSMIDMDTLLPIQKPNKTVNDHLKSRPGTQRPSISPMQKASPTNNTNSPADITDRYGDEDPLLSWAADYKRTETDTSRSKRAGSGKHGGAYAGRSSDSSKAAKREQKRTSRGLR